MTAAAHEEPPLVDAELGAAVRAIALATNKFVALHREAMRLGRLVACGDILRTDAVDALMLAASNHGLNHREAEHIVEEGLSGRDVGVGFTPRADDPVSFFPEWPEA